MQVLDKISQIIIWASIYIVPTAKVFLSFEIENAEISAKHELGVLSTLSISYFISSYPSALFSYYLGFVIIKLHPAE
jgi:hypothetical protein